MAGIYRNRAFTIANTRSYIAAVTFPVLVFCREGWKQPIRLVPRVLPVPRVRSALSSQTTR